MILLCLFYLSVVVNNVIFKAVDAKDHQAYSASTGPQPPSSAKPVPETVKSQTPVDEEKPKCKAENQWKAPWLNIQRNKQRQGSSDNVIRPHAAVSAQMCHDAASILKHKLDAKSIGQAGAKSAAEISSARSDSHSGMVTNDKLLSSQAKMSQIRFKLRFLPV